MRHKYVWPTHHFYDKMYCYEPRQRLGPYRGHHSPLHLSSQKKKLAVLKTLLFHFICVVVKIKIFEVFPLSCNDNNYMTYSWPNSAFLNFQEYAKQENCRQYLCIVNFFSREIRTKKLTKRKFIVEPSFFTSWTITSEKCTRAHVQENKSIYLSLVYTHSVILVI